MTKLASDSGNGSESGSRRQGIVTKVLTRQGMNERKRNCDDEYDWLANYEEKCKFP